MICDFPYGNSLNDWDAKFDDSDYISTIKSILAFTRWSSKFGIYLFHPITKSGLIHETLKSLKFSYVIPFTYHKADLKYHNGGKYLDTLEYGTFATSLTDKGDDLPFNEINNERDGRQPYFRAGKVQHFKDLDGNVVNYAEKDVKVIQRMISTHCSKDNWILSCCSGTGTDAIAALSLMMNVICVENNMYQFKNLQRRITEHLTKMKLESSELEVNADKKNKINQDEKKNKNVKKKPKNKKLNIDGEQDKKLHSASVVENSQSDPDVEESDSEVKESPASKDISNKNSTHVQIQQPVPLKCGNCNQLFHYQQCAFCQKIEAYTSTYLCRKKSCHNEIVKNWDKKHLFQVIFSCYFFHCDFRICLHLGRAREAI